MDLLKQLRRELDETRARLGEANEALDAIRHGEVDTLMTTGPDGQTQIFTLTGAQEPYRLLIEQMSEGALTLSQTGVILYANQPMARLLGTPLERIIGAEFRIFVAAADQPELARLLDAAARESSMGDVTLFSADGKAILVRLGLSSLSIDAVAGMAGMAGMAVVVTDQTAERQFVAELEQRVAERTAELDAARLEAVEMMEDAVTTRDRLADVNLELVAEMTARHASEERYRFLFENMLSGFLHCKMLYENGQPTDFIFLDVNRTFERVSGLSSDVIGKKISTVVPCIWESDPQLFEMYNRVATTGQPERLENYVPQLDRWFDIAAYCPQWGEFMATFDNISQRKRAEAVLEQATQELCKKNAELEQFLYTASHDLKSPLVTIRTFLGYIEQDLTSADPERLGKDMQFIRAASEKMTQLLDDLLEISRVGHLIGVPLNVTLYQLIDDACSAVAGQMVKRGVTTNVTGSDVTLFGDRHWLCQIWQNLLDNACKFIGDHPTPHVEFGVQDRSGDPIFFVRDNGIGIDPCYHDKIFKLFDRLDPKIEGTGIGLALIRRIVEFYGGKIWVESQGAGGGSCFYFNLPKAIANTNQGELT